jgi:hypothetical protein
MELHLTVGKGNTISSVKHNPSVSKFHLKPFKIMPTNILITIHPDSSISYNATDLILQLECFPVKESKK